MPVCGTPPNVTSCKLLIIRYCRIWSRSRHMDMPLRGRPVTACEQPYHYLHSAAGIGLCLLLQSAAETAIQFTLVWSTCLVLPAACTCARSPCLLIAAVLIQSISITLQAVGCTIQVFETLCSNAVCAETLCCSKLPILCLTLGSLHVCCCLFLAVSVIVLTKIHVPNDVLFAVL